MKDVGNLNRPSDSWENSKKSGLEKMAKGRGQGLRAKAPPTLSLLLFSTFVFLRSLFCATVHYAWNRLVHSGPESFFQCQCKGSIDVHLGAFDIFKAHTHAATIPALALVKRRFFFFLFSVVLWRKVFSDWFLMMVFHRRSKRVKIFSETFLTKYLQKSDSNTSKLTSILLHNYQKEKSRKKKESVLIRSIS